jgi:hypothetical protein
VDITSNFPLAILFFASSKSYVDVSFFLFHVLWFVYEEGLY